MAQLSKELESIVHYGWIETFKSDPIKRIASENLSEGYDQNEAHVFELKNGEYALVIESGCSCYNPADAEIELFPTKASAMRAFNGWIIRETRSNS